LWQVGSKRIFDFPLKNHVELGEALEILDFEAAAEVYTNGLNDYLDACHIVHCKLEKALA
jgi:seryl-tRNA synthetase